MNTDDPADIAPLSYGAALALGLLLILGLPRAEKRSTLAAPAKPVDHNEPEAVAVTEPSSRLAGAR